MMKGLKMAGVLASSMVLMACSSSNGAQSASQGDIWQSPGQVMLAETPAKLDSYLWLNSMPVVGEGDNQQGTLLASVKVVSATNKALPTDVTVKQVLLATDDQQWLANSQLEVNAMDNNEFEVMLRKGPNWPAGTVVNVALTLNYQGKEMTLTQRQVKIDQVF
ncbi:hypothetical protein [Photobacterium sanguinicancri]|uniref:DUF3157 domain-containing protein n=2 Tax=Photobacterium sanguinicancri TaxID=875932 RepID=A0AAW7Y7V0_9GAMM|nr:hypothetical protein [Photobacterium sanguinicancri]MDO6543358.1 hypothetical protein [Photobacterium sanguinicancri]